MKCSLCVILHTAWNNNVVFVCTTEENKYANNGALPDFVNEPVAHFITMRQKGIVS